MKKIISLFLAMIFSASLLSVRAFALEAPEIISETAVLMDAETGQVLYQKNPQKRMYPASTTKIMTGLLVAENCSPAESAKASATAIGIEEWDSANIALAENEEMRVDSLMYAMMMPSANDAANVLAEHIAVSQDAFAAMMNSRAVSIGATSTHFANAHGLHNPNHYTTAYDLALITREAIKNKTFVKYFGASTMTVPSTNLNPYERPFINYQYMLVNTTAYYDPAVTGGKVGYTHEAEHTMSTVAEKGGRKLICTVMKSPNRGDKFEDTKKLLDFGFNEFIPIRVEREKFSGFEQKIINGEEHDTGIAKFRGKRDFKALLHTSLDPSALEISYSSVYEASDDTAPAAYAEFRLDTGNAAVPNLLGQAPLERSGVMYAPADFVAASDGISAVLSEKPWVIPLAMFSVVLALFLLLTLSNRLAKASREKRRQKNHEERVSVGKARYRGPVPDVGKHFMVK